MFIYLCVYLFILENSSNLTSQLSQHMPDIEELVKEGAKQKYESTTLLLLLGLQL